MRLHVVEIEGGKAKEMERGRKRKREAHSEVAKAI